MTHTSEEMAEFITANLDVELTDWQRAWLLAVYAARPHKDPSVVHCVTTLGPTDEPGLVVQAHMLAGFRTRPGGPLFYQWDRWA